METALIAFQYYVGLRLIFLV